MRGDVLTVLLLKIPLVLGGRRMVWYIVARVSDAIVAANFRVV